MAELEKELGLALGEQQLESLSARTPTSLSPLSAEAPQDKIQSRERSETTVVDQKSCEMLVDMVPQLRALSGSSGRLGWL
jgi:hypothetical protein